MNFQNEKKQALSKIINYDNSKKGDIDKQILPLVKLINNNIDYYTTSSCAGRIMILSDSSSGKKFDVKWLFSSHDRVEYPEIEKCLKNLPKEAVWLRMEPPIIHIACSTMESADNLMKIANDAGFRRSALLSFKKRKIVEIMIPEKLDVPISSNGHIIVTEDYLKTVLEHANDRLIKSRKKLTKLEKFFKELNNK